MVIKRLTLFNDVSLFELVSLISLCHAPSAKIEYSPALPAEKLHVLQRMPVGYLTKIIVTYSKVRGVGEIIGKLLLKVINCSQYFAIKQFTPFLYYANTHNLCSTFVYKCICVCVPILLKYKFFCNVQLQVLYFSYHHDCYRVQHVQY